MQSGVRSLAAPASRGPHPSKARPYGAFFANLMGLNKVEISKVDLALDDDNACGQCRLE